MSFYADKQTLEDLNINGKFRPNSVFSIFNKVHTKGGERLLEKLFSNPLSEVEEINARSAKLKYFEISAFAFPFSSGELAAVEQYLEGIAPSGMLDSLLRATGTFLLSVSVRDERYEALKLGINATLKMLSACRKHEYLVSLPPMDKLLEEPRLVHLISGDFSDRSIVETASLDLLLANKLGPYLRALLEEIYLYDVFIAVSSVGKKLGFCYAEACGAEQNIYIAQGLFHPAIPKAVGNPIDFDAEKNVLFLTGANMAGKSTLMKSFGISVYLAHMGFPVAASSLRFSVKEGIFSSVNVPDNLSQGYSHFYAEVLRVKTVAEQVSRPASLYVIFDELFKGTNVKDAYDATLEVTDAFSKYTSCFFIISTHITEVGDALGERNKKIQYAFMPTLIEGNVPKYTYTLTTGISTDRQGMTIIENEGILDMLSEAEG